MARMSMHAHMLCKFLKKEKKRKKEGIIENKLKIFASSKNSEREAWRVEDLAGSECESCDL